jgi:hypothetical protein
MLFLSLFPVSHFILILSSKMCSVNLIFLNAVGALLSEHVHDFIRSDKKRKFPEHDLCSHASFCLQGEKLSVEREEGWGQKKNKFSLSAIFHFAFLCIFGWSKCSTKRDAINKEDSHENKGAREGMTRFCHHHDREWCQEHFEAFKLSWCDGFATRMLHEESQKCSRFQHSRWLNFSLTFEFPLPPLQHMWAINDKLSAYDAFALSFLIKLNRVYWQTRASIRKTNKNGSLNISFCAVHSRAEFIIDIFRNDTIFKGAVISFDSSK